MHNYAVTEQLVNARIAGLRADAAAARLRRTGRTRRRFVRRAADTDSVAVDRSRPSPLVRPPAPHTQEFSDWASELATHVATQGIAANELSILALVKEARSRDVNDAVVAALADRTASAAARERALGFLLVALSASPLAILGQRQVA